MNCSISYEAARERYPQQVAEIVGKAFLSATKSKKTIVLSKLRWSFDWCVRCDALNAGQFIERLRRPPELIPEKTEDEEVADYQSRCEILLKAGRFYSETKIAILPEEIAGPYRQRIRESRAETARFGALSPDEKRAELNNLLKKLQKNPGFMVVSLKQ